MRRTFLPLTLASILLSITSCDQTPAQSTSADDDANSDWSYQPADPGRGFYRHTERRSAAENHLDVKRLQAWRASGSSLVIRVIYLSEFIHSPLSPECLSAIDGDFSAMRTAGVKGIIRFAYSSQLGNGGNDQADSARVLEHVGQLAPLLKKNKDVIHCVQAGFIGAWGEWHAPHPSFKQENGTLDPVKCRSLIHALLAAVPEPIYLQIRTPWQKKMLFDEGDTRAARVGHHNDCFLASANDVGTYRSIKREISWLAKETETLPMGGETCKLNPPRSSGKSAIQEMERLHYNYLNRDYHPAVLKAWKKEGQLKEIAARLGHRIKLTDAYLDGENICIELLNQGFARPLYDRPMEYRWNGSNPNSTGAINFSIRSLLPGKSQIIILPKGEGQLEIRWPDVSLTLQNRGEYALFLANPDIIRDTQGWHQIIINSKSNHHEKK